MCEIAGDLLLGMMGREGAEEADVTKLSDPKHVMERNIVWWSQAYVAPEKPAEASTEESEHLPVIDILGLFSITLHKELRIPDPT